MYQIQHYCTHQRKRACISAPIILFKLLELAKWPLLAGPSCLERRIGAEIPTLFLWSMLYCRLWLDYCRGAKTQNQWILNALSLKPFLGGFHRTLWRYIRLKKRRAVTFCKAWPICILLVCSIFSNFFYHLLYSLEIVYPPIHKKD